MRMTEEVPANEKTAEVIAGKVADKDLNLEERHRWVNVVHYAFGTTMGGLYGVVGSPRRTGRLTRAAVAHPCYLPPDDRRPSSAPPR